MITYSFILDFIVNFSATVLGVLLAFFLQRRYNAGKDKDKIKDNIDRTKKNLINELEGIALSLSAKEYANGKIHFDTPVWKAVIATGSILEILIEEDFYNKLLEIYGKLFGLRKMEENFSKNEEEIIKLRREIVDKIKGVYNGYTGQNSIRI